MKEVCINLIQCILNEKCDLNKLYYLLWNNYYVNLELFNIPIYYGEEELFFANLISEIYQFFCVQKELPKKQNLKKNSFSLKKEKTI